MGNERLLNINEVSEYLGIPVKTLYDYSHKGQIPVLKVNGHLRFRRHEILQYFEKMSSNRLQSSINDCDSLKIEKEMKKRRDLFERRLE